MNASIEPSGDTTGWLSKPSPDVIREASPPPIGSE